MVISSFKEILILFGALFAFALVTGKLAERKRTIPDYLMMLIIFDLGIYQLISYFLYCRPPGEFSASPHLYYMLEAAGFMIFLFHGPLNYFYCLSVARAGTPLSRRLLFHFVPGILYSAVYIPVVFAKAAAAVGAGNSQTPYPGHGWIYLLSIVITVVSFDVYMVLCLRKVIPLLSEYPKRKTLFKMMAGTFLFTMAAVSFWPVDILFGLQFTDDVRVMTSLYLLAMYVISRRHPERMVLLNTEEQRQKYLKTQIQGMDIGPVVSRLEALMRDEKIYKREITLGELAVRLGIRRHQLSEILNAYMKTTFSVYINDQRVGEAMRLIEAGAQMRIIGIAMDVGYNSLSVFYREFKKRTGVSPAEYIRGKTDIGSDVECG